MRAVLLSTFLAVLVALISISLAMPQQILAAAPNTTNFSENHQLYDTGADIAALQQFLNTHGFLVALSGPGAPGEETGFFGILTYQALIKFQAAHGLPATGFFGPLTRALLNGSDTTQTAPTTSTLTQTQISAILSLLQSFGADQATVNNVQAALCTPGTTHATTTAAAPPIYTTPPPTPAIGQPWHAPSGGGGGGSPDTTAPVITLSGSNPLTVAQGGTFTDPGASATDNWDGTVSVSVSGSVDTSTLGTYTLTYSATDHARNTATATRTVNVTDQTSPVVSSIATSSVNNTSAIVTWTTNEAANSKVAYGLTSAYGSATSNASLVTSHSIILTGLTASTTYHFAVVSTDSAGNAATSSDQTFTTQTGLLGVNMAGAFYAPALGIKFPNSADWTYLASKGVTFVRMPIAWENLQPTLLGALNSTYLTSIENAIASAHAAGIGVIVDLHNGGGYANSSVWNSTIYSAGNGGTPATGVNIFGDGTLTSSKFADLWTRISTALAGTPGLIGYGLMNEPAYSIVGTNLLFAPNGFGDGIGSQPWFAINSSVVTQLAAGTNPLGGTYGPAWSITSGSGYGGIDQEIALSAVPYTLSVYAKVSSGSGTLGMFIGSGTDKTVTTSWQRFTFTNTPSAGLTDAKFTVDVGTAQAIQIANAQLEQASSASTYQPNPYLPFVQAAISAVRAVDASTPIYINGSAGAAAYQWPWVNWEMDTLTGGNLVFEAHQYFDGSVTNGGGGGNYSGTYTSYGITTSAGVQESTPFVSWLQTTGTKGYLGEFGIPDNSKGDQASWLTLQKLFLQNLIANNIPATMWFYDAEGAGSDLNNILNVATSTTANSGGDDPRLIQMLQQF